jgi:peptide/nickel transport system substrate-binding protein
MSAPAGRRARTGSRVTPYNVTGVKRLSGRPVLSAVRASCAALLLCALAAAASAAALHAWTNPGELRLVVLSSPHSLNPILNTNQEETILGSLVFDYLLSADRDLRLVPELAAVVPTSANGGISRDGKTITYTLRRGVRWHDGKPFTSADVAFSFHLVMDPKVNVQSRLGYDEVASVETPDDFTVRFHLKRAYAPILRTLFAPSGEPYRIVPKHLLAHSADVNQDRFGSNPVGTGPYRFVSWQRGDRLEYAANADYWGGKPKIPRIVVRDIPDLNTVGVQLRTHALDLSLVDSATYNLLRATREVNVTLIPQNAFVSLSLNMKHVPLDDVRVRRAIAKAIDRRTLTDRNTFGTGDVAFADLPWRFWADRAPADDPNAYDVPAARALLDAAGWAPGKDGIRERNGKRLELELAEASGGVTGRNLDVQIQAYLKVVGIDLTIKSVAPNLFFARAADGGVLARGAFDLASVSWIAGIDPDNGFLYRCDQVPPEGSNYPGYCSTEMDALQAQAIGTYDERRRRDVYARIERLAARDVPWIFLYNPRLRIAANLDLRRPAGDFVDRFWHAGDWRYGD